MITRPAGVALTKQPVFLKGLIPIEIRGRIENAFIATFIAFNASAQHIPNWQNKDLNADSLLGISTEKAYKLLKGKTSQTVTVAVIDAGIDTLHEDLKTTLWTNPQKSF